MALFKWIDFPVLGDDRGSLVALESGSIVPFEIERAYYIFNTKASVSRGFHAHKNLKQIAVCVSGQCKMVLDDGVQRGEVLLNSPNRGLFIDDLVWREMHDFSSDCVLLVLASRRYDESDYIRDYAHFREVVKR